MLKGDCDDRTEMAQRKGEAKGADTYVGDFAKGRPDGKGVYTWQSGARLEGSFKGGKAHGPGVYVSAKGVRYEGQFVNGKLEGLKTADCPSTPGRSPAEIAAQLTVIKRQVARLITPWSLKKALRFVGLYSEPGTNRPLTRL